MPHFRRGVSSLRFGTALIALVLFAGSVRASQVHFYPLEEMIELADTLVEAQIMAIKTPPPNQPFDYEFTVQVKEVIRGKLTERQVSVTLHYPYDPVKSVLCPASGLESKMKAGESYLLFFGPHEPGAKTLSLLRGEPLEARERILKLWKNSPAK